MDKKQFILGSVVIAGLVMVPACSGDRKATAGSDRDAGKEFVLLWSDEFNKDGPPNPENWIYEQGFVRNEELQWYQPDNARCEGGLLVIEGRRERVPNPRYAPNGR